MRNSVGAGEDHQVVVAGMGRGALQRRGVVGILDFDHRNREDFGALFFQRANQASGLLAAARDDDPFSLEFVHRDSPIIASCVVRTVRGSGWVPLFEVTDPSATADGSDNTTSPRCALRATPCSVERSTRSRSE